MHYITFQAQADYPIQQSALLLLLKHLAACIYSYNQKALTTISDRQIFKPKYTTEDPSLNFDQWVQFESILKSKDPHNIIKEKSQSMYKEQIYIRIINYPPYYLKPYTENLYETILNRLRLIYTANDKQVLLREKQQIQIQSQLIQISDLVDIARQINELVLLSEYSPFQQYYIICNIVYNVLEVCGHKYAGDSKQSRRKLRQNTAQSPNLLQEIYEEADQLPGNSSSSTSDNFQENVQPKHKILVNDLSDDQRIALYTRALDIQQLQDFDISKEETILNLYISYDLLHGHPRLRLIKNNIYDAFIQAFNYFLIDSDVPFCSASGENFPSSGILPFEGCTSIMGLILSIPGHNYGSTFFLRLYQNIIKKVLLKTTEMLQVLGLIYFILDSNNATIALQDANVDINEEIIRQLLYFFPDLELKDRILILDIAIQCCDKDNMACKQAFSAANTVGSPQVLANADSSGKHNVRITTHDTTHFDPTDHHFDLKSVTGDDENTNQSLWFMGMAVAALLSFKARIIKQLGNIGECCPKRFIREMSGIKLIQLLYLEYAAD